MPRRPRACRSTWRPRCNWPASARSTSPRRPRRSSRPWRCNLQAKALWIPNINGGVDYFRHDGVQQNIFTGENFRKGRQSFFVGGGPYLSVGLTDAIFAPLAARRVVAAREADLQTAQNDVLLQVTQAFFNLQASRGRILGIDASIERAEMLVNFARGLAPSLIAPLEINRAQTELQTLRQTQQVAIRDWRVASAQLAEVLLLDPETLLEPVEPPFLQVTLVPCDETPEDLVPIAVHNRPEIASRRELVAAAEQLLRREKNRPFLPSSIRPQPDDVHRPARGRQLLRRPQRCPEQQRLADGHRARRGLAAPERRRRQRRADPAAPRRARPGLGRVHPDDLPGPLRGLAIPGAAPDRPAPRGRDRGRA